MTDDFAFGLLGASLAILVLTAFYHIGAENGRKDMEKEAVLTGNAEWVLQEGDTLRSFQWIEVTK